MIVADPNLIVYFAIRDSQSEWADAVYETDSTWVAPLLWRSEFCNALTKYMQFAGMSLEMSLLALHAAEEVINGREYKVSSPKVLELAYKSKCSAYDCEYIALAQDLGVPLVTANKQVLKAFPKMAVSLEKFAIRK